MLALVSRSSRNSGEASLPRSDLSPASDASKVVARSSQVDSTLHLLQDETTGVASLLTPIGAFGLRVCERGSFGESARFPDTTFRNQTHLWEQREQSEEPKAEFFAAIRHLSQSTNGLFKPLAKNCLHILQRFHRSTILPSSASYICSSKHRIHYTPTHTRSPHTPPATFHLPLSHANHP